MGSHGEPAKYDQEDGKVKNRGEAAWDAPAGGRKAPASFFLNTILTVV